MPALGPYHPLVVHTPVALLVFSAFFALVGRLFDRDWVRRAAVLMLVFGFLGAFAAVRSGQAAHRVPEHQQGVPEHDIDEHAEAGRWTLWVSGAAIVMVFAAARLKGGAAKGAAGALALLLQLAAAACVARAGFLGGGLVYDHGASVRVGGALVHDVAGALARDADRAPAPAGGGAPRGRDRDGDDDGKQ